tara:strand:+ start:617 stop:766 length:150 start_codon:yes stop_codon:yes gene_type:complete
MVWILPWQYHQIQTKSREKNNVLEDIAKSDFYKELYTKHKKLCRGKNNG